MITAKQLIEYHQYAGPKAKETIKILQKIMPFINAVLNTEVGRQLMEQDLSRHEDLLLQVYNDTISLEDKAEFKYLRRRLQYVASMVSTWIEKTNDIQKSIGGENA